MSYLKTIRDHARALPLDDKRRQPLLDLADAIKLEATLFATDFDISTIQHLNALFALSNRLITDIKNNPPGAGGQLPSPTGDDMPVEENERIAA